MLLPELWCLHQLFSLHVQTMPSFSLLPITGAMLLSWILLWFLLSSLLTGPSFMSISLLVLELLVLELWHFSFIRDRPEIENPAVWVLLNICGLGQVRDTKLGTSVSSKLLLNSAICQGYSFCHFWVIMGESYPTPTPPRFGSNFFNNITMCQTFKSNHVSPFIFHFFRLSTFKTINRIK